MFHLQVLSFAVLLFALRAFANEDLEARQSCPSIHIFGARETTVPPGYGTAGFIVNLVLNAHPGATAEAISYPACGGQVSCGGISYANSVVQGVAAVASVVNSFNTICPESQLVLVGYSQGGQIMDDAFCGGGDANEGLSSTAIPIQSSAINMIKAAIFVANPRYVYGLPYQVGTCKASGFAPRPSGFICPNAAKIQSYCDASDPYCCNGNNVASLQRYGAEYAQAALTFINGKLATSGSSPSSSSTSPTST